MFSFLPASLVNALILFVSNRFDIRSHRGRQENNVVCRRKMIQMETKYM